MAAPDLAGVGARFADRLRSAGVPVNGQQVGRWVAAISLSRPAERQELYWLARVTLLSGRDHIAAFDREFAAVFGGEGRPGAPAPEDPADWRGAQRRAATPQAVAPPGTARTSPTEGRGPPRPVPGREGGDGEEAGREIAMAAFSPDERLRRRDLATLDDHELQRLQALATRLAAAPPPRRSRRWRRAAHGSALDVRATLRAAHRTGGEPLRPSWRRRRHRPRRLVLLSDVSGSMEAYARAYLTVLAAAVGGAGAEAFVFATRLTRVTRELRSGGPASALERAARAAPDWSGGTRIGAAIKRFNDDFGRRGLAHGAIVVIISDGWDRGDSALLAQEMGRLRRLAWRIIWVNPRKARPAYQPLTGGMAAALPHVDRFLAGHTLAAFEEVLAAIGDPTPDQRPPPVSRPSRAPRSAAHP